MPAVAVSYFQSLVADDLSKEFGRDAVIVEWATLRDASGVYSPRLDIAVGPFATGTRLLANTYNAMHGQHRALVGRLWNAHVLNVGRSNLGPQRRENLLTANYNARCFMSIEIENRVSRKHLMGGALNAAALGRVAIVVGWDDLKLRALIKLRRYFMFLSDVNKPTFSTLNLLILSPEQLSVSLNPRRSR